jgi:hypothetical protein
VETLKTSWNHDLGQNRIETFPRQLDSSADRAPSTANLVDPSLEWASWVVVFGGTYFRAAQDISFLAPKTTRTRTRRSNSNGLRAQHDCSAGGPPRFYWATLSRSAGSRNPGIHAESFPSAVCNSCQNTALTGHFSALRILCFTSLVRLLSRCALPTS